MATTRPLVVDSRIRQSTNSDVLIQTQTQIPASTPSAPAAGNVIIGSSTVAGRTLPIYQPELGQSAYFASAGWQKFQAYVFAVPNSVGFTANGITISAVGTSTARSVVAGNIITAASRTGYVSSATAGNLSGYYQPSTQQGWAAGTGSFGGGFISQKFIISDAAAVSGARAFIGMSSSTTAPTNVEPSTLTNSIGVAQLSTDSTQLYLVYGGTSAQTPIALGTGFPPMAGTGINAGPYYNFMLYSPPSANGQIFWTLQRLDTGTSTSGSIGPDATGVVTPGNSVLLLPRMWRCNNATALAVGIDNVSLFMERDY